jgi:hypothetical protein
MLPFFFHWYVRGAVPVAPTVKVAVWPAVTVWLAGCDVIEGATAVAVTVSVAGLLVMLPTVSVIATLNDVPLSPILVAGVV